MSERELTRAEKLVEELALVQKREKQFETWRWQASRNLYKRGLRVTEVVTASTLGFKRTSQTDHFEELPYEVAREFHSFLAAKRDENYRRGREIERELERISC